MFEMMLAHDLLLAHPSICSELESLSLQMDLLKRQPVNKLRYTTAVDTLAPMFDMAFFQDTVMQTLQNANYGKVATYLCSLYCYHCHAWLKIDFYHNSNMS